jgi:acylphosphatase
MKNHSAEMVRNRIIVSGKVQGVGYRKFVVTRALELNLSGYCRNLPSGEVEIDVEGPYEKVQELIRCLQIGPSRGKVDQVIVSSPLEPLNESTFVIQY